MQFRPLGTTGLNVSNLCLGTMQFRGTISDEASHEVLDAFFEAGGNFLDTADMYSQWVRDFKGGESETVIGNWMRKRGNRDKIVLATKVRSKMWEGPNGEGLSRSHILKACENSLRRLQTDRIDLYQSHWPDTSVPIEETLSAYESLIQQGKVRFIGCSNYNAKEMKESFSKGQEVGVQYICCQPHYNLVNRLHFEKSVLPLVLEHKMAVIPYSPLAGGFLTGKYRKGRPLPKSERAEQIEKSKMTDKNFAVIDLLDELSKKNGKTISQVALGWLLAHDWMTAPIVGANSIAQLNENLGASDFTLAEEDKNRLDKLSKGF